jgi:hypothetical protein
MWTARLATVLVWAKFALVPTDIAIAVATHRWCHDGIPEAWAIHPSNDPLLSNLRRQVCR